MRNITEYLPEEHEEIYGLVSDPRRKRAERPTIWLCNDKDTAGNTIALDRFTTKTEKEMAMSAKNLTDGTFAAEVLQSAGSGPRRLLGPVVRPVPHDVPDRR